MSGMDKIKTENQQLKQELDIVTAINSKIHMKMNFDNILDEIIITLRENIDFDGCNFSLIDKDGYMRMHKIDYSRIENKSKISQEAIDFIANAKWDYKTSTLWTCITARDRKEIYYPEIKLNNFSKVEQEGIKLLGATSWYSLPIKVKNKIFGTMAFANYGGSMYLTKHEKNLIRRTVDMIARALDNFYLYKELKEKNDIIHLDLLLAKKIQQNFLPKTYPKFEEIKIATSYFPMIEVGGDYYDFHVVNNGEKKGLGVLITDASGHGVHAAFLTSMVKMSFKSDDIVKKAGKPAYVLSNINSSIIDKTVNNFVTAFYAYFDFKKGKIKLACAGHPPVMMIDKKTGKCEQIQPAGKLLGVMSDPEFEILKMDINKDMRFVFYTDGLIEAENTTGIAFEKKLTMLLSETAGLDIEKTKDIIISKLEEHVGFKTKQTYEDDIALIIIDTV